MGFSSERAFFTRDLYPYYVFLTLCFVYIYSFPGSESFLLINSFHTPFLDRSMMLLTFLGDGIFVVAASLLLMLYKVRMGLFSLFTYSISGILAQVMKRFLFPDQLRPLAVFRDAGIDIYTIPGLDIPLKYSFPSGHSTTSFAFFIGLSFFVKPWGWKLLFLFLAVVAGYSRVYLAMHFPEDVIAGSFLGVTTAVLCYNKVSAWKKGWLNKSVLSINFKNRNNENQ